MNKLIFTLAITIAFSTLSFGQIKVTPFGDFAVGQNFIPNNWVKCEINGEQKPALSLKTNMNEVGWGWNSIADCNNPRTKSWIASLNGSHNFFVNNNGHMFYTQSFRLSDSAVKTNIQPLTNSYELINQLNSYYFDYKPGFNGDLVSEPNTYTNQIGFIAQEVNEILPQLVVQESDTGKLTVDYVGVIPLLVAYVKEQDLKIQNLQAQMASCCSSAPNGEFRSNNGTSGSDLLLDAEGIEQKNNAIESPLEVTPAITIKPNPNKGLFEVSATNNLTSENILITDLTGQAISSSVVNQISGNAVRVDLTGNRSGVYYVHYVVAGEIVQTKKVVTLN